MSDIKFDAILGLLGLIGIAILILIYILKPNFQQKFVSSTYVWKLSLKYKRKRIPISKVRNLLIIICQILVLASIALILAKPYIAEGAEERQLEKILIIDASASMLAKGYDEAARAYIGPTRFERAVARAKKLGQDTITQDGGQVTVILAGQVARPVVERQSVDLFNKALDDLVRPGGMECSFGQADIDGAIVIVEEILVANPAAEVVLYTATTYTDCGKVIMVDVSEDEWNAAILDVTVALEENWYIFEVEVASYNRDMAGLTGLTVYIEVYGANADGGRGETIKDNRIVTCIDNKPTTVKFDDLGIFSYESAWIHIDESDSFSYDNNFYVFGGTKRTIKALYISVYPQGHPQAGQSGHNSFLYGALLGLQDVLGPWWNIEITMPRPREEPELIGFDFYIFEHSMPEVLPRDGIVLLVNPNFAPDGSGLEFGEKIPGRAEDIGVDDFFVLSYGAPGPLNRIIKSINPSKITVSQYTKVVSYDGYQPLMVYGEYDEHNRDKYDPLFLVKDEGNMKVAVLSFNLNFSKLPMLLEFPALMLNLFDYFLPPTLQDYIFDVGVPVSINARGSDLSVVDPLGAPKKYEGSFALDPYPYPGIYTVKQQLLSNNEDTEWFFVRIPAAQSDFLREEAFYPPYMPPLKLINRDLLIFLASALFALVVIERLLHIKGDRI